MKLPRAMPVRIAGLATIALAGATALAACSSGSATTGGATTGGTSSGGVAAALPAQYGSVPLSAADTGKSGTITMGTLTSNAPTWILPIVPGADSSVYTFYWFVNTMWRPLYEERNGAIPEEDPAVSIANVPQWTNNDQTVTVTLKPNYTWSDGKPVTSADVLFWYDVVKAALKESAANWGQYNPGLGIPDQVSSVSAPNSSTFVLNLTKPVNPQWFDENQLPNINPMPEHVWSRASAAGPIIDASNPANAKKIWDFLNTQSKTISTYTTNPLWQVVDGPFKLTAFNATTGDYTLTPNPSYGGPHAKAVSTVKVLGFASETSLWNAVKAGTVDVTQAPSSDVTQIPSITGTYNDFGYPAFGFNYVAYNFKDTTADFSRIIGQLYIRQAIASLEDQQGIIRAFFHGAAGQAYGPVPAVPATPFTPSDALTNPYPFSVQSAISTLKAHGWTVNPGGTDICSSPGSGANQCGAGIPAGTKLAWNLIYAAESQVTTELVQNLASDARQAGITLNLQSSNFNTMINDYNDPSAPKNDSKWAMEDFGGFSIDAYPTMIDIFNTPGTLNIGGYGDQKADTLMNASVASPDPNAVKNEAAYLTQQQPGLFQPLEDRVWVWHKTISGPPSTFQTLTQFRFYPEQWYFTK